MLSLQYISQILLKLTKMKIFGVKIHRNVNLPGCEMRSLIIYLFYFIHVHIYPYRLGNPLDVEQTIVNYSNKMITINT
jgi:hypothetical protein